MINELIDLGAVCWTVTGLEHEGHELVAMFLSPKGWAMVDGLCVRRAIEMDVTRRKIAEFLHSREQL